MLSLLHRNVSFKVTKPFSELTTYWHWGLSFHLLTWEVMEPQSALLEVSEPRPREGTLVVSGHPEEPEQALYSAVKARPESFWPSEIREHVSVECGAPSVLHLAHLCNGVTISFLLEIRGLSRWPPENFSYPGICDSISRSNPHPTYWLPRLFFRAWKLFIDYSLGVQYFWKLKE